MTKKEMSMSLRVAREWRVKRMEFVLLTGHQFPVLSSDPSQSV